MSYESRLKQKEDVTNNLERDASYLKRIFSYDGQQNYLVYQLVYGYLKRVIVIRNNISTIYVHSWTSKGMSNEQIKAPGTSRSNDQAPALEYDGTKIRLRFDGDVLKQNKVTYAHKKIVNIYIVYELVFNSDSDLTPKNSLFGAVKLTINSGTSKYNILDMVFVLIREAVFYMQMVHMVLM